MCFNWVLLMQHSFLIELLRWEKIADIREHVHGKKNFLVTELIGDGCWG